MAQVVDDSYSMQRGGVLQQGVFRKSLIAAAIASVITSSFGVSTLQTTAVSQPFPYYAPTPALTSYVSGGTFNNTYYVNFNTGLDTNNGTAYGTPWKSLNHAMTIATGGDIIYILGGTYLWTTETGQTMGDQIISGNGTATDHIVIAAYPGETPIIEVDLTHVGSHGGHPGGAIIPIQITGNYIVIHGLTFAGSGVMIGNNANACGNIVIQGCTCLGNPSNLTDDQIAGTFFLAMSKTHDIDIFNNDFDFTDTTNSSSENGHAIKSYSISGGGAAGNAVYNVTIKYNRIYGCPILYGAISQKSQIYNWTIQHNAFINSLDSIALNINYNSSCHDIDISYNVCINPSGNIQWLTFGMGAFFTYGQNLYTPMYNVNIHDNVLYNSNANIRFIEKGAVTTTAGGLGECYNNVIATCRDAYLYSATGNEFDYCDYNAYLDTTTRDTFDNNNAVSGWQANCIVNPSLGISTTGTGLNTQLQASATSPLKNAGRGGIYNPNIAFTY